MTEHFGTRLARLIASQHLNQGQFAERLKCSPAFISEEISYMVSLAKSRKPGEPNEEFYQRALSEAVSKYNALTTDNVTSFLNR